MEARLLHNIFLCRRAEGQQGWWGRSWTVDPHPLPTPPVYLYVSRIWPLFSFHCHAPSHLLQTPGGHYDLQRCGSYILSYLVRFKIANSLMCRCLFITTDGESKNGFRTKLWLFFFAPIDWWVVDLQLDSPWTTDILSLSKHHIALIMPPKWTQSETTATNSQQRKSIKTYLSRWEICSQCNNRFSGWDSSHLSPCGPSRSPLTPRQRAQHTIAHHYMHTNPSVLNIKRLSVCF